MVARPQNAMPMRLAGGFCVAMLGASAGILLPLALHGVRNVPWEVLFGFGCYVTGFFRGIVSERLEGFLSLIAWPLILFGLMWCGACRAFRLSRFPRLILGLIFVASLAICVSADTSNDLGARLPLFWNELNVRF